MSRLPTGAFQILRLDHGIEFKILRTVNPANQDRGRAVYRFIRDELGAMWLPLIPNIERTTAENMDIASQSWSETPDQKRMLYTQTGDLVIKRLVAGKKRRKLRLRDERERLRQKPPATDAGTGSKSRINVYKPPQ
jgi:sulfatase maturation enzyme AslB (radical SAM superfamily)